MRVFVIIFISTLSLHAFAQKGKETKVTDNVKRSLSRTEIRYTANKVDSIKRNLNRMIRFEKELRQRNYYLNEKTSLMNELVSIIQSIQQSLEVVMLTTTDVKGIFGKPSFKSKAVWIYEIETYGSNCPFIQITFSLQQSEVIKLDYKITDCQKWK